MLIPDNIGFNYYTVLSRTSSLMIRQNSILMAKLMNPDILVDIQMNRYGTFDFDKSEKLIAIGRKKTTQVISKYEDVILSTDFEPKFHDQLQCTNRCIAIVLFFFFRQFLIWY